MARKKSRGKPSKRDKSTAVAPIRGEPVPAGDLHPHEVPNLWFFRKMASGIRNVGNTCFLGSTVQCLQHVPSWLFYLMKNHQTACREEPVDCVVCKLKRLAVNSFVAKEASSPEEISLIINSIGLNMQPGCQEDAHEFLTCLFEKIQKNLTAKLGKIDPPTEMTTALGKIFGGYLRSQTICLECHEASNSYEEFFNISLDVSEASTIEQALASFVAPESMDDSEWFSCERCSRKRRAEKCFTINSLPSALILHLKRYSYDGQRPTKNDKFVEFDERIDLKPYLSGKLKYESAVYLLSSVTVHMGLSLTSGHYLSYVSDPSDYDSQRNWFCMNDSEVYRCQWDTVKKQQAYILYYMRASTAYSVNRVTLDN